MMNIIRSVLVLALYCKVIKSDDTNTNKEWCPKAKCISFGSCNPCTKEFLFIIAQARSGGTTIKNMINLLPGIRVSGEVGSFTIKRMMDLWKYVRSGPDDNLERGRGEFESPWGHHDYPEEYLSCPAQALIESINPPENIEDNTIDHDDSSTIIGFKEISMHTSDRINFLYKHFPCSRFIFNIRGNNKELKESQIKHFGRVDSHNDRIYRLYTKLKGDESLGDMVYFMDLDKWSKSEGREFNDLAKWLGFENCQYPFVLHDNRGLDNAMDRADKIQLSSSCRRSSA